jgi:hypothetical protein
MALTTVDKGPDKTASTRSLAAKLMSDENPFGELPDADIAQVNNFCLTLRLELKLEVCFTPCKKVICIACVGRETT